MFLFFQQFVVQNVLILFLYAICAKLQNFNTFSDRVQNVKETRQIYVYFTAQYLLQLEFIIIKISKCNCLLRFTIVIKVFFFLNIFISVSKCY